MSQVKSIEDLDSKVVAELTERPYTLSHILCDNLGLSVGELVNSYKRIGSSPDLWTKLVESSKIPEFSFSYYELLSNQHSRKWIQDVFNLETVAPRIIEYHPAFTCNYSCTHCFSRGVDYEEIGKLEERISFERMISILKECRDLGVESFWISGGKEPLVDKNVKYLIYLASEMYGFKVRLYTNGFFMSEDVCRNLLSCEQIRVSMDSPSEKLYNLIHFGSNNSEEAFQRVLGNIKTLIALRNRENSSLRIAISQVVHPGNYKSIFELVLFGSTLGVDSVQIRREMVGRTSEFTASQISEIRDILARVRENKWGNMRVDIRGLDDEEINGSRARANIPLTEYCFAGLYKKGINPWGQMYHCEFTCHPVFAKDRPHLKMGDLRKQSVFEIIKNTDYRTIKTNGCSYCQAQGIGLNWQMFKLLEDAKFGVMLEDQPFIPMWKEIQ